MLNQIGFFLAIVALIALLNGLCLLGYELVVMRKCVNQNVIANTGKKKAIKCFAIGYTFAIVGMLLGFIAHNCL